MVSSGDNNASAYNAFISYRRSDGTAPARKLRRRLLAYKLPKVLRDTQRGKLKIFMDTAYERGAADFYEGTIKPALMAAKWLIIIATPDAVQRDSGDDWIAREVSDFTSGPNGGNIVVVRAKGELLDRLPADVGTRFPNMQVVDLRNDTLLSRLSPQVNARLSDELVKVAAPIFGVKLEDMPLLRREEERKQMALLGGLAGFATAVVLGTVAMSIYTLQRQQEARAALDLSLQVTERNLEQLLSTYAETEPLDSAARHLVFNNCELAARLKSLGAVSVKTGPGLLCQIEEAAAMEAASKNGEGMKRIQSAITGAKALRPREDLGESIWRGVAQNGYSTLALLSEGPAADVKLLERAVFEEADAEAALVLLEKAMDNEKPRWRERAHGAWQSAAELRMAVASRLAASKWQESSGQNEQAARLQGRALSLLVPTGGLTAQTAAPWLDQVDLLMQPLLQAVEIRQSAKQAAMSLITWAQGHLAQFKMPDDRSAQSKHVFDAKLLLAEAREPGISDPAKFAALKAAVAKAGPEAKAEQAALQETAARVVDEGLDLLAAWIDGRRAVVKSTAEHDKKNAAALLEELIAAVEEINTLRTKPAIWDDYYLMIALRDLAAYRMAFGDGEGAQSARLKAQDIHVRWIDNDAKGALAADRAREAEVAWEDTWNGHHARIDDLRARADKAEAREAIRLMEQLVSEDAAWDSALGHRRVWDDVYEAGARVQLATLHAAQNDQDSARKHLMQACARLLPYNGVFDLADNLQPEARRIWTSLKSCTGKPT